MIEQDVSQNINGAASIKLDLTAIEASGVFDKNVLVVFQFKDNQGQHCSRQFEQLVAKYPKAKNKDVSISYEDIDLEAVLKSYQVIDEVIQLSGTLPNIPFPVREFTMEELQRIAEKFDPTYVCLESDLKNTS